MSRKPLDVTSPTDFFDWLVETVGSADLPGYYERGDELVFVPARDTDGYRPLTDTEADDDGPAQIRGVDVARLRAAVAHRYACTVWRKPPKGDAFPVDVLPPHDPTQLYVAGVSDPANRLPRLRGVIHTPYLRDDGSVVTTPGYDRTTGLLYRPPPGLRVPKVPDTPTPEQVNEAAGLLLDLVCDFPWVTDSDRGTYVAHFLVGPLLRPLVPRPYPGSVLDAHQQGSGKTLLANVADMLHGAVTRSEFSRSEDEVRKVITSVLKTTTAPFVVLDNMTGRLSSGQLAAMLTMASWSDRPLGVSATITVPNDRMWVVTGNNVALGGDLPRRFPVWVRIDPDRPDPHLRNGFRHSDLLGHVHQHRGTLLHAALVLARHWTVEGRPLAGPERHDSYGTYLRSLAGLHSLAGLPGQLAPADVHRERAGEHSEDDEVAVFLAALHRHWPSESFRAKDVAAVVAEVAEKRRTTARADGGDSWASPQFVSEGDGDIADTLPEALVDKVGKPGFSVALGRWFGYRVGRWSGEYVVRRSFEDRTGAAFRVEHRGSAR